MLTVMGQTLKKLISYFRLNNERGAFREGLPRTIVYFYGAIKASVFVHDLVNNIRYLEVRVTSR